MEANNFFVKNKSIVTFLILEVIALTAFNFGNVSQIFGIAGAVLGIVSFFFVYGIEKDKKSLLPILIPLGTLFVISLIGSLNQFSKGFTVTSNISLMLSLPAFLALGFSLRKLNDVKPRTVLFVIGGAFAAITLFGLFSTILEYGFFYRAIYKSTPNYYYNGERFNVTKEMFWLNGFEFGEVFVEYGSLFAVLCGSFLSGLLFLSPKKDKQDFIICACTGGVGLLTLLVLPNFSAIIVLLIASLFALVFKLLRKNKKNLKIIGISFIIVLFVAAILFLIAMINSAVGYKLPGFLNRLFAQNRFANKVTPVFDTLFAKVGGKLANFFGFSPTLTNDNVIWLETGMFEAQLLKEIGLIGTLLFAIFLGISGYFTFNYLKKSEDHDYAKSVFVTVILAFFIYESFYLVVSIAPHNVSYEAFLRSPALLIILFVIGYIFIPTKEEIKHE